MKERASKRVARGRNQDDRPFKLRLFIPDPAIRSITWQRTTEMYGIIERLPGVTWEQVEKALAAGCYYRTRMTGRSASMKKVSGY